MTKNILFVLTALLCLTSSSFAMDDEHDPTRHMLSIKGLKPIDVIETFWENATGTYASNDHDVNPSAYLYTTLGKKSFPREQIEKQLASGTTYFDRVADRVLKLAFFKNNQSELLEEVRIFAYDHNHGKGKAKRLIEELLRQKEH